MQKGFLVHGFACQNQRQGEGGVFATLAVVTAERRVVGHALCFRVSGRVSLVVETFDGADGMVCGFVFETKD